MPPLPCLLLFVYLFNIPFGYWRARTKKFSKEWILSVHLPVPFIFAMRMFYGVGWEFVPLFVVSFFLGQLTGGRIRRAWRPRRLSSCLFVDSIRILVEKLNW
ncbi:MAG: hypothetical protein J7K45_04575 [Thaumarchaeota archaeon]|nr:hypothetical protein [Nitrososphaerota archaeon]